MENNITTFKTKNGNVYIYDGRYNIVYLDKRLKDVKFQNNLKEVNSRMSGKTTLLDTISPEEVKHYILRNGLKELMLEVTTGCNLRCKYCVYSDNYPEMRTHGNREMTLETAKKAVDYYISLYEEALLINPHLNPIIGFYGGEPLLNFSIIKEVIDYVTIERQITSIQFTLTTNAVLLTDEIIKYLIEKRVLVLFSIDGPKEQHDRNRVTLKGAGTYDTVIKNVEKYIKGNHVAYTNSVYDFETDLYKVAGFFNSRNDLLSIGYSPVNPNSTKYYDKYTEEEHAGFNKRISEVYDMILSGDKKNRFLSSWVTKNVSAVMTRIPFKQATGLIPYTGGCVPGDKIYVTVDGFLLVCEKLSREFKIGDIDKGLDFTKISEMVNEYNKAVRSCKDCILNKACSLCYATSGHNGKFEKNPIVCESEQQSFFRKLSIAYSLLENDESWFEKFNNSYLDNLERERIRNELF